MNAVEPFRPTVDGTNIKTRPIINFKNGNWHKDKFVVIGSNSDEIKVLDNDIPTIIEVGPFEVCSSVR